MPKSLSVVLSLLVVSAQTSHAEPCELTPPTQCFERGLVLFEQGDPESVAWFVRACDSKVADACSQLSFVYFGETNVLGRDDDKAWKFARLGCDLGSGLGCANAVVLLRDSRGMARDDGLMRTLADRACALESDTGCYLFGAILEEEIGGKNDQKKAHAALTKACGLGHLESCVLMAERHLDGLRGLRQDIAKGAEFLEKACELGHGPACNLLGIGMVNGEQGYPKGDAAAAATYFQRGCDRGFEEACENFHKVTAKQQEGGSAVSSEGATALKILSRNGKRVEALWVDGAELVAGAGGEVSKEVTQAGFKMSLTIGTVKVVKANQKKVTLEVVEDQSEVVVNGKKVNHWTSGTVVELKWQTER